MGTLFLSVSKKLPVFALSFIQELAPIPFHIVCSNSPADTLNLRTLTHSYSLKSLPCMNIKYSLNFMCIYLTIKFPCYSIVYLHFNSCLFQRVSVVTPYFFLPFLCLQISSEKKGKQNNFFKKRQTKTKPTKLNGNCNNSISSIHSQYQITKNRKTTEIVSAHTRS